MLSIQLRDASFRISFPIINQYDRIIELAETFMAYEATQPVEEQTAVSPQINTLLTTAQPIYAAIELYDDARVEGSERLKPFDTLARDYFDRARRVIYGLHEDEPTQVLAWGFTIRQTGRRAGQIEPIEGRQAYLDFFDKYVAHEESRPAEAQFTFIMLAEMRRVRDGLRTNWRQRNRNAADAQQQRATLRDQLAPRLLTYLRIAFSLIVMKQYDGQVQPELKKWGYTIASRQPLVTNAVSEVEETKTAKPAMSDPLDLNFTDPDTGVTSSDLVARP